ncbi:hypothetical protein EUZ08_23265, partial [Salmonella enterica]|nr:hypothetical protein [Salmonella enterica]
MFSDSSINKVFVYYAVKINRLIKKGLISKIVMNHLKKIRDNLDDSFYMNSSTIEVFEDENIFL